MESKGGKLTAWAIATVVVVAFVAYMTTQVIRPAALATPRPEAAGLGLPDVLFYVLAVLTVAGAAGVALSRNILYSTFGLLTALLGAGALYVLLSADFVAVTQLLIYIGGVLVLILFAVMLTNRITEINVSNTSFGLFGGFLLFVSAAPVLLAVALLTPWQAGPAAPLAPTTQAIGDAFLSRWLLPFEVASLVLLSTLVGAIVIARKEIKAD
ncbi:NADH-ubiquinone/plastoquinone oxidoreductase chain 6 [Anaeromyxobacter sp. K]|uniref:NADH-quinone oxidoreductase subunit J n=1 Tax=Anaeromyxobacter dehalogenans (strain ATCC BAA-258 / DSM 21875 / 2CP-1) TaxID=455488 RepID=B8JH14_ANAD2|nr:MULTISPECIES: NADH-quinone oxidoreductase subunit J [Anaeromyxobacter]ACG72504.1 NADH-ubiquinone/plastoquinone oxidoreductase chain 6 [Anaeromyxobacter sp. K]ACL64716.1 NADH-ubiquinone/plastoquinone oxidoreductase chain 6 [Anaeromyxobacter dehalogenans 2CP-1]